MGIDRVEVLGRIFLLCLGLLMCCWPCCRSMCRLFIGDVSGIRFRFRFRLEWEGLRIGLNEIRVILCSNCRLLEPYLYFYPANDIYLSSTHPIPSHPKTQKNKKYNLIDNYIYPPTQTQTPSMFQAQTKPRTDAPTFEYESSGHSDDNDNELNRQDELKN